MKHMNKIAAISALLIAFTGCKQQDPDSSIQSLDNFAKEDSAKLTVNKCGINYTGKEKLSSYVSSIRSNIQGAEAYRNAAIGVLEAVPQNLMATFFGLGGSVVISKNSASICGNAQMSAAEREFAGESGAVPACWTQPAPGNAPQIVLPEDINVIRHSLVRLFAYTFTEAFVATIQNASSGSLATKQAKDAAAGFVAEREKIATAFLADLKGMDRPQVYERLAAFNAEDKVRFGNYVYAEAVDSYYCSSKTRATFSKNFAKTWARFTDKGTPNSPVNLFGSR